MGHFFRYCFPKQEKQPAFIKNKKQYDAFYVPALYCFPGRILQPLTKKKRTLKQDSSLWVISLIMSSTWGHFVFFRSASKQLHAVLLSWRTTPAAIAGNHVAQKTWNWCHLGKPHLLPPRTDSATPKELFFASHIDAVVVDGGPDFLVFQCYSMTTDSFVTYFPRNLKNPHLFYGYGMGPPRDPFRRCKTM